MTQKKISTLEVIQRMVNDDNQGIRMSKSLAKVEMVKQGAIIGFGIDSKLGIDASNQSDFGIAGENIFLCFAVNRKELEKTRKAMEAELETSNPKL